MLRQPSSSIELFWMKIIKQKGSTKIVSQIYKCLQSHMSGNILDTKEKWELDINVIIEDETWEQVCEEGQRVTKSPLWKEFGWKLRMRYFRTPFLVAKFNKNKTNLCWTNYKKIGDHTHIFWDCAKLKPYWEVIHTKYFSF